MTEEELKAKAKQIAEKLRASGEFDTVEFVDEDEKLEGEPASIMVEFDGGEQYVLGVLPL